MSSVWTSADARTPGTPTAETMLANVDRLELERTGTRPDASDHVTHGTSSPLGATPCRDGVNFSVFSKYATGVELLLFDHVDDAKPAGVIRIEPATSRTYHYWHVFVPGVRAGQLYGYRVEGPWDPANGMRFDPTTLLLDPYGRGVAVPDRYRRDAAREAGDNSATAMKSVVADPSAYDWEGDEPLRRPSARSIVYEMHVRGFIRHPSSGVSDRLRGTFAGLIEKIPYLQRLGITAVELLPVFQFDAQGYPPGKVNYWGYWFDWTLIEKHADLHRFVSLLNARRVLRDVQHESRRVSLNQMIRNASKTWHGVRLGQPDWSHHSHSLALEAELRQAGLGIYLILNAYWEPLDFELPQARGGGTNSWRRWIDTALDSPQDIVPWQAAVLLSGHSYRAAARSVVVLFREIGRGAPPEAACPVK